MPVRHFYLFSHYICNGLFFLFSVCWLHVNEFNSLWERDREGDRRSWLIPMLFPLCWTFFQVSLMIIWYRNLSLYMMILSLYCRNISFFSKRMLYVIYNAHLAARMPRRSWIRMYDKYKGDFCTFFVKWQPPLFLLFVKENTESSGWYIFRANSRLLTAPPFPAQKLLYSFLLEPKHRK